jgi:hypothetical protein
VGLSSKNQKHGYIPEQNGGIDPDKASTEYKYEPGQSPGYVPQYYDANDSGAHLDNQEIVLGNQNPEERVPLLTQSALDEKLADEAIGHDQ